MPTNGQMAQEPPGGQFRPLLITLRSLCYNPARREPDITDTSPSSNISTPMAASTPATTTGPTAAGTPTPTGHSKPVQACCLSCIHSHFEHRNIVHMPL